MWRHFVDLALSQDWPDWLAGRILSPSQVAPFWIGVGRKGNHKMNIYLFTLEPTEKNCICISLHRTSEKDLFRIKTLNCTFVP